MSLSPWAPDRKNAFCVIGAGASGLATVKTLLSMGIECECLEQNDDVGGIWDYGTPHSPVYQSTHLISSKKCSEFLGYPMPDEYPDYPAHTQVLRYLRSFADHFDLRQVMQFKTTVESVEIDHRSALVQIQGEPAPRTYRGVIVANGHLWKPVLPKIEGEFAGQIIHAADYKTPDVLRGKRVLVVGAGNSGCDIAVEASRNATDTLHSIRRGRHFVPKFLFGKPIDTGSDWLYRWRMPHWVHRLFATLPLRTAIGTPQDYGLPAPEHRFLDEPPVPNSDLLHAAAHGRVRVRPDIARFEGDHVHFTDGKSDIVDVIVMATGYQISFPFLQSELVPEVAGVPQFFLNIFHPEHDNLMFAGLLDASTKTWELVEHQAMAMAWFIRARDGDEQGLNWLRKRRENPFAGRFRGEPKPQQFLYLEYFWYRNQIDALVKRLKKVASKENRR